MNKGDFIAFADRLRKKYDTVEFFDGEDENNTFLSFKPYKMADVEFFLFMSGHAGWNAYVEDDTCKPSGKSFPSMGETEEAMTRAIEYAISEYVKECQGLYDDCLGALVNFGGWTLERAMDFQELTEGVFTEAWRNELGIKVQVKAKGE